jgi:hypothetical protein
LTGAGVPAAARTHEIECGSEGVGLQLGIDRARDGDTLLIRGVCREAVTMVNRKLNLMGAPGATLEAPDYPWTALPYSTLHPLLLAVGSDIRIEGLTIDGRARADDPWASGLTGIHLLNSKGSVVNNRIVRVRHSEHQSDWEVSAIRISARRGVPGGGPIRIEENLIEDFETNGIFVQHSDGSQDGLVMQLMITGNRIRGAGAMIQNQNGIQIGGLQDPQSTRIRAKVINNVFDGFYSHSGVWSSSALYVTPRILDDRVLLRPYKLECSENVIEGTNTGFSISSSESVQITRNTIQGGDRGMWIHGSKVRMRGNRLLNLETGVMAVDSDLTPSRLHHSSESRVRQNLIRVPSALATDAPGRGATGKNP